MGVFGTHGCESHLGIAGDRPYTCMVCESALDLQYHACPVCGGYDVRRAEWVGE